MDGNDTDAINQAKIDALVDGVHQSEKALAHAKAALRSYFDELSRDLITTGESQISLKLARRLYWEYPDVTVTAIGRALGVPTHQVHELVGGSRTLTCRRCRTEWTADARKSRTSPGAMSTLCETCTLASEQENKRGEKERAETKERWSRRVTAGDYWISGDGDVVFPDAPFGMCRGCGSDLRRIDDDAAWSSGSGVLFVCVWSECNTGDRQAPTLVRYVPRPAQT